jgi:hypothetical protein
MTTGNGDLVPLPVDGAVLNPQHLTPRQYVSKALMMRSCIAEPT